MICDSGGSKGRLAKAADAEQSGQMRDEKLHSVVARSTCRSQYVKNTSASEHFLEVEMMKKCTLQPPVHYTTLHYTQLHYATLHFSTQPYTTLPGHYPKYNYNYN